MAEQKPADERKSRMGCVIFVVVVALILLAGYTAYRLILKARVRAELAWFAEAGYPTTLEELDAWYPTPPPGENAADVYLQAFQNLAEAAEADLEFLPVVRGADWPPTAEPLSQEMRQAIARYLDANREALRLLHEAAAYEQCRYPIDLKDGDATLLRHLEGVADSARLLVVEAIAHAEENDPPGVVRSISSTLALAESLRSEPVLVSQSLRQDCCRIAVQALEHGLAATTFSEEQISAMSSALATADSREPFRRGLAGELPFGSATFGMTFEQVVPPPHSAMRRASWALYVGSGVRELDHLAYLGIIRRLVGSAARPNPKRMRADGDVGAQADPLPSYCRLTPMLLPTFGPGSTHSAVRAARTALAVERFRLSRGKLPESLQDLVPDYLGSVPLDPFDGKPLRYRVTDHGYIVYSIGADGVDDGGMPDPIGMEPPDITFTVGRPDKRDDGGGNQPEGGGERPVGGGRRRRRPRRPR